MGVDFAVSAVGAQLFSGVALSFSHESFWLLLKGLGAQMKCWTYGCCTAAYSRDETTVLEAMDLVHPHLRSITESLASRVPWARPQCIIEETLLTDPFMRAAYTMFIWEQQKQRGLAQTPPCQVCGLPAGNWCDQCEQLQRRPFAPLCTSCESAGRSCRLCAMN